MSLQVKHLTKLYGKQKAIEGISFSVKEGEIVGFLGPNGAGKSTTMKIIAGCLTSSKGHVLINGFDAAIHSLAAKKITGYLPEHNPLYLDMYVHEYLHFMGGIYCMSRTLRKQRIAQTIEQCGLTHEQNKRLGALSKGYRQRVGLAQALLHDPQILILDEPTSGLDPNQIVEIRSMIKEISKNKTVLFSTHIMQETEALCNRVIIINKGKIVANDSIRALLQNSQSGRALIVQFREKVKKTDLEKITGVETLFQINDYKFRFIARPNIDLRDTVFKYAAEKKHTLMELREEENEMENIFQTLTAQPRYD